MNTTQEIDNNVRDEIAVEVNASVFAFHPHKPILALALENNKDVFIYKGESYSAPISSWKKTASPLNSNSLYIYFLEWTVFCHLVTI